MTTKQTADDPHLDTHQAHTLQLLYDIVQTAPPRDVVISNQTSPMVTVYSDASFEHGVLRLGWVIFQPDATPIGGTCRVPDETLNSWNQRRQQIFPGEALAALVVPFLHAHLLADKDVLWLIDNEAAVASLIRAGSSQLDVHLICIFAHAWCFQHNTRAWYEWIDSSSNPSDGLSRDGPDDAWTLRQGWDIQEFHFPLDLLPSNFLASLEATLN